MTQHFIPTYATLNDTVEDLTKRLEKSQSNYNASLATIRLLHDENLTLTNRIQRLESFLRDQNALLQEHGLAEYGN
jgi:uncharacterized coiled-coil protein SlyX